MFDRMPHLVVAALPTEGGYFSPFKIVLFTLCFLLWAHNAAWVEKDLKTIRVPAGMWRALIFGTGVATLALWLLIPLFWIGFLLFAMVFGGAFIGYALFRNKRVAPAQTILTPAHLQRLFKGGKVKTTEVVSMGDRVRIKDANGKTPNWPTDPAQHAAYGVMQELLFDAIWRRGSDLRMDFIPEQPVKTLIRIDGVDRIRDPLDPAVAPLVLAHLKRISGMNSDEHRRPQTGHFKATIGAGGKGDKSVEVQARTSGSTAGQRFALRLISEESKFRLPDLGLTAKQLPLFKAVREEHKGVVIVSGPKGAGVTSTLYAILREHDAFLQNIHTLEASKDLDLENITQHVFDSQNNTITFGKRLRSLLRTEPDVCMISDLPDAETASLAATAGKQNKKIYIGLRAKDTFSALGAYLNGVADPALAATSLVAVSSQRLIRILCTTCRKGYKPDPDILKKANLPLGENRPFYRPPNANEVEVDKQGNPILCAVCQGTGYLGRTGVFELLIIDDELRARISKGDSLAVVKAEARKKGMLYLQEVALHKVYDGITSINEVLRVTKEGEK
ncbi:MAG TPA: ATPase, T2SS/T4P/T4SS family [Phycisphaerae bacterium]|nr:ATPase, T2SS/T4P/T4SS family [Phycisphaerae bacterium]